MCQTVANRHLQQVKTLSSERGNANIDVTIDEQSVWLSVVPATPAIAVFNAVGELVHLGPYAEGIGCFTGQGIVGRYIEKTVTLGATVLMEAEGCYCRSDTKKAGTSQPFAT